MYSYDNNSLNSSQNKKCFWTKVVEKINTRIFMFNYFFSPENRVFYEIMWRNKVELDRSQMTI
jgi:hypothetical protein